jgi:hypothetical protein
MGPATGTFFGSFAAFPSAGRLAEGLVGPKDMPQG